MTYFWANMLVMDDRVDGYHRMDGDGVDGDGMDGDGMDSDGVDGHRVDDGGCDHSGHWGRV